MNRKTFLKSLAALVVAPKVVKELSNLDAAKESEWSNIPIDRDLEGVLTAKYPEYKDKELHSRFVNVKVGGRDYYYYKKEVDDVSKQFSAELRKEFLDYFIKGE